MSDFLSRAKQLQGLLDAKFITEEGYNIRREQMLNSLSNPAEPCTPLKAVPIQERQVDADDEAADIEDQVEEDALLGRCAPVTQKKTPRKRADAEFTTEVSNALTQQLHNVSISNSPLLLLTPCFVKRSIMNIRLLRVVRSFTMTTTIVLCGKMKTWIQCNGAAKSPQIEERGLGS